MIPYLIQNSFFDCAGFKVNNFIHIYTHIYTHTRKNFILFQDSKETKNIHLFLQGLLAGIMIILCKGRLEEIELWKKNLF